MLKYDTAVQDKRTELNALRKDNLLTQAQAMSLLGKFATERLEIPEVNAKFRKMAQEQTRNIKPAVSSSRPAEQTESNQCDDAKRRSDCSLQK